MKRKPGPSRKRASPLVLSAIVVTAFLVRLIYVLEYRGSMFFSFPIIDSATYDRMAWDYAQGKPLWKGAFWQPPLYPWALGLLYKLMGHTLLGARLVQAALGATSCLLVYAIGRRVFDWRAGIAAAAIMAAYGTLVFFDGEILVPSLYIFLLLAGLLLLLRAAENERRGWAHWMLAGSVFGLAALTRSDVLLFCVLAAWWGWRMSGGLRWRQRVWRPTAFLLGVGLVVSVVTIRNVLVARDLVWISSNGGLNFYIGNNAEAAKTVAIRPGFAWESLVNEPYLNEGIEKASGRSSYFFRKGFSFLEQNPMAALDLYAQKFARFWNAVEIGRNRDVYATRDESRLLSLLLWRRGRLGFPFGIVAPIAIAGMVTCFSKESKRLLLNLYILAFTVSVILFFVASRYRLSIVPVLILFAAQYGVWVWERIRRRDARKRVLISAGVLLLAFPAVNQGFPDFDRAYRGETHRYLGVYHADAGRPKEAETEYGRALVEDPDYAEAHAELGQLLLGQGRNAEALDHFRRAQALCPFSEQTEYLLGTGYAAAGDTERAAACFLKTIESAPHPLAHRDLGILRLAAGRVVEAEQLLSRAAHLNPDDLQTWYKLGQCRVLLGRFPDAEAALVQALRLAPGDAEIAEKIQSLKQLQRAAER